MILYSYDENQNKSGIDVEKWRHEILPILEHGGLYYQFEENELLVEVETLSNKMVIPILFYTLLEMADLLNAVLENEDITADLLDANKEPAEPDNYGMLRLNYLQSEFINAHEKEVKAWMPLAIKKYVRANNKRIKDVCCGRI